MPASIVSRNLNLKRARRFVATSPSSARLLFFLAIHGLQVHAPPGRFDSLDPNRYRIPEAHGPPGLPAHLGRLLLVHLEPLAGQRPRREETLVDIAQLTGEGDEEARTDDSPDLALEGVV